jgi:hypothetical protein
MSITSFKVIGKQKTPVLWEDEGLRRIVVPPPFAAQPAGKQALLVYPTAAAISKPAR